LGDGHTWGDATALGLVAGGKDAAAAHEDRFVAEARPERLFDGGEEGINVDVGDVGCGRRDAEFGGGICGGGS
jgi:hypothetical protein